MRFEDSKLNITSDKIVREDTGFEIMMNWEDPIMKRHAEIVCRNGGDILEIGFGMGISANYIQECGVKSHTIVENHPQIIKLLKGWAKDKENIIIIEGDWFAAIDRLPNYDGIFYDAVYDPSFKSIGDTLIPKLNDGGVFTFFNPIPERKNPINLECDYEILSVSPDKNSYFNSNEYYLPFFSL